LGQCLAYSRLSFSFEIQFESYMESNGKISV
jgi:hypothetical protein